MHGDLVIWNAFDTSYIPIIEVEVHDSDSGSDK